MIVQIYEGHEDFATRRVRLYVGESLPSGRTRVLLRDGTWFEPAAGAALPDDATLILPREALETLAAELERFLKGSTHKGTEAAVLREWLAAELERTAVLTQLLVEAHEAS